MLTKAAFIYIVKTVILWNIITYQNKCFLFKYSLKGNSTGGDMNMYWNWVIYVVE